MFSLPEQCKIVFLYNGAANAVACDYICCKNAHMVWFLIFHAGSNDTDLTLGLQEGVDVAATGGASAVTDTFPIWKDVDPGTTSDTLVRQTDAASLVIDPATQNPVLAIFQWDPAKHAPGYDCISVSDSGGHASNTVQILAFILERYQADQPPSAIID